MATATKTETEKKHGRGHTAFLNKKQLDQIQSRLKRGEFLSTIAPEYGYTFQTVRRILREKELPVKFPRPAYSWNRDKERLLQRMVKENKTTDEISEEMEAPKLEVAAKMRELGINRPRGWRKEKKQFTPEQIEIAKKMYSEGYNHTYIRKAMGLKTMTPRYVQVIRPMLAELPPPERKQRTSARKIGDKEAAKIVDMFSNQEMSISDIATKMKVSHPTVVRVLKQEKVYEPTKREGLNFTDKQIKDVTKFLNEGGSIAELGKQFDYTAGGMYVVLKRHGLLDEMPNRTKRKRKAKKAE